MKTISLLSVVLLLVAALAVFGQSAGPDAEAAQSAAQTAVPAAATPDPNAQIRGRGRGGVPHAWNDKDRDGICDVTGKAVAQDRPMGFGRGGGRGRIAAEGNAQAVAPNAQMMGHGRGRARGRGRW